MKNQAKRILSCLRFVNSRPSIQLYRIRSLHSQVTSFSNYPLFLSPRIIDTTSDFCSQKKLFFSSRTESVIDEIVSNRWLEKEQLTNTLSHETVIYILMKLDKDPQKVAHFFKWVTEENGFRPSSVAYSLMLRIYANKDAMPQFWSTTKEMKENGFYLDEETYLTIFSSLRKAKMVNDVTALKHFYNRMIQENAMGEVVKKVVDVIKDLDWGGAVERRLGDMKLNVTDNFVLRVLKELRAEGLRLRALSFFRWVSHSLSFEHNSVTYNGILRILCREESVSEFWGMVREMQDAGFEIDIDTYVKIAREFRKSKLFEDLVKLYEHMMDSPFKPLATDCSLLLRFISSCKDPDLDLVFRVKRKHEAAGFCLSKTDYDGIHRSLTSVGNFEEAEKLVETMRNAGYQPDNITYSQLIFGLCKARRLQEAYHVLDRMEAEGLRPDIVTWTILIKGYCDANEVDKALLCFAKMVETGLDADADLLEVLVRGFINQNKVVGAYQLVVEMTNRSHLKAWQSTFKNLIEKLLGERRLEEALNLLRLMKKQEYSPHVKPFTEYVAKSGSVEDALELLKATDPKSNNLIGILLKRNRNLEMIARKPFSPSKLKKLLSSVPLSTYIRNKPVCNSHSAVSTSPISNQVLAPYFTQNTCKSLFTFRPFSSEPVKPQSLPLKPISRDGNYDDTTSEGLPICPGCGVQMQDSDPKQPGFFTVPMVKSPDYKSRIYKNPIFEEPEVSDSLKRGFLSESVDCEDAQNLSIPEQKSPEKPLVCTRCHSLRFYGKVKDPSVENLLPDFDFDHTVGRRLTSIKWARTVVLMVVDASDFDGSFPRKVANLVSKTIDEYSRAWKEGKSGNVPRIVLVVTKIDLLPSSLSPTTFEHWVRTRAREGGAGKLTSVHLVSAVRDWGIKNLVDDVVDLAGARGQVWAVGAQNAGKSTLLNAIGKCTGKNVTHLTEAPVPGTTLGILRVEGVLPGNAKLFDTPGLLHPHQILTRLTSEEQKLVYIKKELKPRTYRINVGHSVHVGGLLRLDVEELSTDSLYVTVWASPLLPLHMGKTENASAILEKHFGNQLQPPIGQERVEKLGKWVRKEFRVSGHWWDRNSVDIAAAGLGWFAIGIRGEAVLGVWSYDGVDIVSRNALLPERSHKFEVAGFTVSKIVSKADRAQNKRRKNEKKRQTSESNEIDQKCVSTILASDSPQTLTGDSVCSTL
ncbi:OLC1v1013241C1 [Oldenlandia corymbosa var. corymbosa]|uniref:OLC1v1013241C1 n=1 Tax=Oldenlandia corymbosa var. corymbosa TaxID=529605 RepID=A0AAV1DY68_OLDCO|nr:OLC1v1013241C1 [Oldenlandia corymbosa var. corymbosa]